VFDEIGTGGGAFVGMTFDGLGLRGRDAQSAVGVAGSSRLDDDGSGTAASAGPV
jgi:hypothetical protein